MLCSLSGPDIGLKRACLLVGMFPPVSWVLTIWRSLIFDAAQRSAVFRYPESRSVVRQGAVMLDKY
jgi:hypothetical protein